VLVAFVVVVAASGGCRESRTADERGALAVVRAHVAALAAGDVAAVRATVVEDGPAAGEVESSVARLAEIGARLELTELAVEDLTAETAVVSFDLEVRGGEGFRDFRLSGRHELQRVGGEWKIAATTLGRVEYRSAEG
jgi:hypothetical protein